MTRGEGMKNVGFALLPSPIPAGGQIQRGKICLGEKKKMLRKIHCLGIRRWDRQFRRSLGYMGYRPIVVPLGLYYNSLIVKKGVSPYSAIRQWWGGMRWQRSRWSDSAKTRYWTAMIALTKERRCTYYLKVLSSKVLCFVVVIKLQAIALEHECACFALYSNWGEVICANKMDVVSYVHCTWHVIHMHFEYQRRYLVISPLTVMSIRHHERQSLVLLVWVKTISDSHGAVLSVWDQEIFFSVIVIFVSRTMFLKGIIKVQTLDLCDFSMTPPIFWITTTWGHNTT